MIRARRRRCALLTHEETRPMHHSTTRRELPADGGPGDGRPRSALVRRPRGDPADRPDPARAISSSAWPPIRTASTSRASRRKMDLFDFVNLAADMGLDARRADLVLLPARRRQPTTCTGSSSTPSCSASTSRARRSATTSASRPAPSATSRSSWCGPGSTTPPSSTRRSSGSSPATCPRGTTEERPSPARSRGSRRRSPTPPRRA